MVMPPFFSSSEDRSWRTKGGPGGAAYSNQTEVFAIVSDTSNLYRRQSWRQARFRAGFCLHGVGSQESRLDSRLAATVEKRGARTSACATLAPMGRPTSVADFHHNTGPHWGQDWRRYRLCHSVE